ncbi:MAG TPA: hypothetical protein VG410_01825 [Solirubrobacteraceae bacterium]|jgi:hypothetical protein|nr:hypothetical protein [Solirubrobacteraceae bacterium]
MRRLLVVSTVAFACLGATVAAASTPPRAHLRGFKCTKAIEPAQRIVSVKAVMRPLRGTRAMELQFDLFGKTGSASWTPVHGGDLGNWISPPKQAIPLGSRPGDVWTLNHPVADLPAPATYKFGIHFRWLGAHNRIIGDTVRESPTCYQPELRPDLVALAFTAQPIPNKPKHDEYTATVKDSGLTGAGPFELEITGTGFSAPSNVITIDHIDANQKLTRSFSGPVCSQSAAPVMTIDPTQQVDVYTRAYTTLAASCPSQPAVPAG